MCVFVCILQPDENQPKQVHSVCLCADAIRSVWQPINNWRPLRMKMCCCGKEAGKWMLTIYSCAFSPLLPSISQDPEPFLSLSLSLTYFRPLRYISPEEYLSPNLSRTQPGVFYPERQNKIIRNYNETFFKCYYYYCYIICYQQRTPHSHYCKEKYTAYNCKAKICFVFFIQNTGMFYKIYIIKSIYKV